MFEKKTKLLQKPMMPKQPLVEWERQVDNLIIYSVLAYGGTQYMLVNSLVRFLAGDRWPTKTG